jgi:CheY-like chemotaxis protein
MQASTHKPSSIKMDGFELLREIRALGADTGGSVPVIDMTAFVAYAD